MNSSIFLIIRDINNFIIENNNLLKNKITLEKEIINYIRVRYKNINYHTIYHTIQQNYNLNEKNNNFYKEQVKLLQKIPQFEQRTKEWYNVRNLMITASDIATVINENPYQKSIAVLRKKCGLSDPFKGNVYTEWGVKYEEIANQIYQIDYNTTVIEFGLIQHPHISYIGASPDGITVDGIMLEIKCPYRRKLNADIEHGGVPHYYWIQVQIQLEVCNLEYCDFQQCILHEYDTKEDYIEENFDGYKGCVVCEKIRINKFKYIYAPSLKMTREELDKWLEQYSDEDKYNITWWKLTDILYTRIQRDREWFYEKLPIMETFWNNVIYYRRHGNEELKPKPRKKKVVKPENIVCMVDTDEDE